MTEEYLKLFKTYFFWLADIYTHDEGSTNQEEVGAFCRGYHRDELEAEGQLLYTAKCVHYEWSNSLETYSRMIYPLLQVEEDSIYET